MNLTFHGVRGSVPVPGRQTVRYGGNTPCLSLELDDGHTLVLDAGSGIHNCGHMVDRSDHTWLILLSHPHWDHVQGFPLFGPLMHDDARVEILAEPWPGIDRHVFALFDGIHFPIRRDELAADIVVREDGVAERLGDLGIQVRWMPCHHRGRCMAYRIDTGSRSLVYMTDNELTPGVVEHDHIERVRSFCDGADLFVHDAQFVREYGENRDGWGHSYVEDALRLSTQSGVGELLLFHHDPHRSDDELDEIVDHASHRLQAAGATTTCRAAAEGLTFEL